ncbi:WapI family immunity protein [Streptobacillus canis]|uniref:WapI family immunity protein n=1 Tax=Streptobacillus canis TaxID=2678686 RepID=UPI0012E19168|nr:hypothetical protein [Streptobacillus canis]
MWLKLNSGGIGIHFRIKRYGYNKSEDVYCRWCRVEVFLTSIAGWLNYGIDSEVLLECEVDELKVKLEELLNNELKEDKDLLFYEPDIEFKLKAKEKILYWIVNFWSNGTLTANYITLTLCEENIEILIKYLYLITGKLSLDSEEIHNLIKNGYIYG